MAISESSALDRLLTPLADCLTPESAKRIADFEPDKATRQRIEHLAVGANQGQLSEAEHQEYSDYIEAMDLVGILQNKARIHLREELGIQLDAT